VRLRLAAAALLAVAACSGDATPTTPTGVASLPPHEYADLVPLLEPLVAPLGFRVSRAALVDPATYETSPGGTHLAVYLVPMAERTPDQIAEATVPVAAAFLPEVFTRWPGLASFDVCQEPYGWNGAGSPSSDTILNVSREDAALVDWKAVTLGQLIEFAGTRPGFTVFASPTVRQSATWTTGRTG